MKKGLIFEGERGLGVWGFGGLGQMRARTYMSSWDIDLEFNSRAERVLGGFKVVGPTGCV